MRYLPHSQNWYRIVLIMETSTQSNLNSKQKSQTSTSIQTYQQLKEMEVKFVDYALLKKVTSLSNKNSLYKLASRMEESGLIASLNGGGKFLLQDQQPHTFEIANFLYQPSYVSLESALSFYGILSQFTRTTTSVSPKKTKKITTAKQEFAYSQIKSDLFWGYEKQNDFLIAKPEKALLDSLYLLSKGIISLDLEELDLADINQQRLQTLNKRFDQSAVTQIIQSSILT